MPVIGRAQEQSDCFMLDANGEPVNLGDLCPNSGNGSNYSPNPGPEPDFFSVPIKRREAKIAIIEVVFNERYTYEMLVDTGASGTVITPAMAETLQIEPEGSARVSTAGGVINAPMGRIKSIATGGITVNDVVVIISPNLPIGLLGQDFFGQYDLVIREQVIEFHVRK